MTTMNVDDIRAALIENFSYDESTGNLIVLRGNKSNQKKGSVAGHLHHHGYLRTNVKGTQYPNHRLVWLYVYGRWPNGQVDHINGIKTDNRLCNLRECSNSQNGFNRGRTRLNRSGYKGVSFRDDTKTWRATAKKNGKTHLIYGFETKELANEFICMFRQFLHGEFAHD